MNEPAKALLVRGDVMLTSTASDWLAFVLGLYRWRRLASRHAAAMDVIVYLFAVRR
jgi:hypothetical protein